MADPKRIVFIPDTQIRPEVPTPHIDWLGDYVTSIRPDVIVIAGDWWDMASLSSHDVGLPMEGRRYKDDLESGNEAFRRFCAPIEAEQARLAANKKRLWKPRKIYLKGNHEIRADRVASEDPKLFGTIGSDDCDVRDFERFQFLERVWEQGVVFSHYFQNPHSSRPIGGNIENMLTKVGNSFVMGHVQGYAHGSKDLACGKTVHGIRAGSCYLHREEYRSNQGQKHWRGLIRLEECDGEGGFSFMDVTLDFLSRRYTGLPLSEYMPKQYPMGDWSHL